MTSSPQNTFFRNAAGLFDAVYHEFKDEFGKGEILLGGSLYYHFLNMVLYRVPGDLDLIVNHGNIDLQKKVSFFFDKVGDGIKSIEIMQAKYKQIGITRVIHHNTGVRIELSLGILDDIFLENVNGYGLYHFKPQKLIRNLFLYFQAYFKAYQIFRKQGKYEMVQLYLFKMRKMYANILMIAEYFRIDIDHILENYRFPLDRIYRIFDQENIYYLNLITLKELEMWQHGANWNEERTD